MLNDVFVVEEETKMDATIRVDAIILRACELSFGSNLTDRKKAGRYVGELRKVERQCQMKYDRK